MAVKCQSCKGHTEQITRMGKAIHFCRLCKLPHTEQGQAMFTSTDLSSEFNPLQLARDTIKKIHPTMVPVGKTALEIALVQALQETYFNGLRDGALLAYSQDYQESAPYEDPSQPIQSPAGHP